MKNKKKLLMMAILIVLIASTQTSFADEGYVIVNDETYEKINEFKDEISHISTIVIAFSAVTSVLIFIIHFIRLASSCNHPLIRSKILKDIAITGICTALIGAIGLISKIFINLYY